MEQGSLRPPAPPHASDCWWTNGRTGPRHVGGCWTSSTSARSNEPESIRDDSAVLAVPRCGGFSTIAVLEAGVLCGLENLPRTVLYQLPACGVHESYSIFPPSLPHSLYPLSLPSPTPCRPLHCSLRARPVRGGGSAACASCLDWQSKARNLVAFAFFACNLARPIFQAGKQRQETERD